jgi:putative molybdopterin biosynthesis protein
MRVIPTLGWRLDGDPGEAIDPRLLPLLEAIAATGSLAAAVVARGISYRAAWGLLRDYERIFGAPLVHLERGRGAGLTEPGANWLQAQADARERLARILPGLAIDLGPGTPRNVRLPALRITVAASHDVALAALSETLPKSAGIAFDLSVMGSLVALREYDEGRAEIAGFHVPIGVHARWDRAPFLHSLQTRRDRLIRFVDREQGLILPRGNPSQVRNLRDVAERKLRFVNRQRGSGTRLLIDRMIADEHIDTSSVTGFANEEFTHPAVAAIVASGGADAGFGLRAAASEYGLAFVPLVRERYFLAVRAKDATRPPFVRLIDALKSAAFTRQVRGLAGYHPAGAGALTGIDVLRPASAVRPRAR